MFDEYYEFRRTLVDALESDLMGPTTADETIVDPPITRYITGILFPQSAETVDPAEDLDPESAIDADAEDTGNWDPAVAMSYVRYPSSLGLTFAVDRSVTSTIVVHVEGARYVPMEGAPHEVPVRPSARSAEGDGTGDQYFGRRARPRDQPRWRRQAIDIAPIPIDISTTVFGHTRPIGDGIGLFFRVRPADASDHASVTIVLINTRVQPGFGRDANALFQARLRVTADGAAAFVHRAATYSEVSEDDSTVNRLLYRTAVSFATGHGTAVDWRCDPVDPLRATELRTCVIPRFELKLSDSNPDIPTELLGMRHLATSPRSDVLRGLEDLCSRYETWILETSDEARSLEQSLHNVAEQHLERCREASQRMRAGVRPTGRGQRRVGGVPPRESGDAHPASTVRLARSGGVHARSGPRGRSTVAALPDRVHPALSDGHRGPKSEDRQMADLLWFPTGGGKTEAYLGLIAFTTFLRRLRAPDRGHGVTVIMRYTLRLLTIQQFERAALLICCLESLRREDSRLGDQPIEIGLWVGRGATPNTLSEAKVSIDKLRQGVRLEKANPLQLQRCPWCATPLEPRNYGSRSSRRDL